ncbi:fimbria/pilus outer membrane usher protein [Variovorax sp. TBS-050B]|uniref:fimbria/pilus outer membrane usher protein n=1 Tax=Variovorax sp. TBS-050B TaxID=2940551 RepID=UPI002473CBAE|nr:fimbria/pilus outer membrane usher protein [Variovorax sp. TBS-050B]
MLVAFKRLPNNKLAATPGDLQAVGIRPGAGSVNHDGLVPLDSLSGISWRYDEPRQLMLFRAADEARLPTNLDIGAGERPVDFSKVRSDFGLVLNYTLYGTWQRDRTPSGVANTLNGSFNARLLTPYGVASTTALARFKPSDGLGDQGKDYIRLDSNWRYTDPANLLVYQAGDSVSGALSWSSSYRFGGFQFRRNFEIRPDLVTTPTPNLTGTASVPSTLDLYLNNIKVFSGEVPAGPFDFRGLPFLGGGGDARIVMKDALGREVVTQRSYFFAPDMLGKGLLDFSVEAGFPRLGYGSVSSRYDHSLAASGSVRYGWSDDLTLEGHLEMTRGLLNGGAGLAKSLGAYGAVRAAGSFSRYNAVTGRETGGKVSTSYQVARNGYSFYVGADRTFGRYNDVGLVVDRRHGNDAPVFSRAREVLRAGLSFPLGFDPSSVSFGVSRVRGMGSSIGLNGNVNSNGLDTTIVSASWSRTLFGNASVYATAYSDLDKHNAYGLFAGLTIPLDSNLTFSTGASRSERGGVSVDTSLTKSARAAEGELGWSLRGRTDNQGPETVAASAVYRAPFGEFAGSVQRSGSASLVTGTVDGAIVVAGSDLFFANRVDDAFAVIKAGGSGIDVNLNGRTVATTNASGRALVPSLRSYQNNTVAIDPKNLSLDFQPTQTQATVVPADRSGVVIDFGVKKVDGAVLVLKRRDGTAVPVGSEVRLEGTDQVTVVGYDGRAYLTQLDARNNVMVTLPEAAGTCRASFDYASQKETQLEIGPITCR